MDTVEKREQLQAHEDPSHCLLTATPPSITAGTPSMLSISVILAFPECYINAVTPFAVAAPPSALTPRDSTWLSFRQGRPRGDGAQAPHSASTDTQNGERLLFTAA